MMEKFETVEQYLANASDQARPLLKKMQAIIKEVAPQAEERIGYGMPGYYHHGPLVYIGGFKNHVSLFGTSSLSAERFKKDLAGYKTSKGTIQLPLDQPLPKELIKTLVRARLEENEARAKEKGK